MNCEVFRRRDCPKVFGVCPLYASDELSRKNSREVRIFPQCLLAASPSWIAEDVDVWGPECQAIVAAGVSFTLCLVVTCAPLYPDGLSFSMKQLRIPRCGHTNGLRKHGCFSASRHAVQCFAPVLVSRNPKPRDRGRIVLHLPTLLVERHPAHQIGNPIFDCKVHVAKNLRLRERAAQIDAFEGAESQRTSQGGNARWLCQG